LLVEVKKVFRPEFLNRIDDIIIFNPLLKDDIVKIVDIELEPLYKKLADQKISLEVTKAAKDHLAQNGFDINFGGRPLKRTIQKFIQDPLSIKLLEGSIKEGDKILVDLDKDKKLSFIKRDNPSK
jgi:ATP-dependent Clp protease ATP-binding subunit ClpA